MSTSLNASRLLSLLCTDSGYVFAGCRDMPPCESLRSEALWMLYGEGRISAQPFLLLPEFGKPSPSSALDVVAFSQYLVGSRTHLRKRFLAFRVRRCTFTAGLLLSRHSLLLSFLFVFVQLDPRISPRSGWPASPLLSFGSGPPRRLFFFILSEGQLNLLVVPKMAPPRPELCHMEHFPNLTPAKVC